MNSVKRTHFFALITILSLFISFIGLVAVYNASVVEAFNDFNDKYYFVKQQFTWLILGLIVYFVVSRLNPKFFKKISLIFFVVALITMILVLIPGLGMKLQGARRWVSLGLFRFQPSELLKTSLVVYLATWLEGPKEIKKFAFLLAACLGLIMLQPDLGTAVIVATLGFGMFYLSGSKIKEIILFFACLTAGAAILIFASPYRLERLKTFLDPTADPLGRSYHINQVLIGPGKSMLICLRQRLTQFLPSSGKNLASWAVPSSSSCCFRSQCSPLKSPLMPATSTAVCWLRESPCCFPPKLSLTWRQWSPSFLLPVFPYP